MKIKKPDFIASVLLLGLTAFFIYQTSLLHAGNLRNELGPRFFPYVCLFATGFLSVILLLSSFIRGSKNNDAAQSNVGEEGGYTIKEALIYYGMILLAIAAVYFIGFAVAMAVGLGLILYYTGWKPLKAGVFSIVSVGVILFVFQILLNVPLPKGILF
jgi:putative tricarboxylic transport membrane protein